MTPSELELEIRNVYQLGPQEIDDPRIQTEVDLKGWIKMTYKENLMNLQLTDSDLEQWLLLNRQTFIPGKIYTFQYIRYKTNSFDANPFIISLGSFYSKNKVLTEVGLNLNKIPIKYRYLVLTSMLKTFDKQIQSNINKIERFDREQIELPIRHPEYSKAYFSDVLGLDPSTAIDFFDRSKIQQSTMRVVKYEHWKYLIYYVADTFMNSAPQIEWKKWDDKQKEYGRK